MTSCSPQAEMVPAVNSIAQFIAIYRNDFTGATVSRRLVGVGVDAIYNNNGSYIAVGDASLYFFRE